MMTRVLPADVYDALELSAEYAGGIGAGSFFEDDEEEIPCCAVGHALFLGGNVCAELRILQNEDGSLVVPSDRAVKAINLRRARPAQERVPFSDWCAELGVVRGE